MHIDHFLNVFFNDEKEESASLESAVLMLTELLKNKYRKED